MEADKLETRPGPGGSVLMRIRARPGASRNALEGIHGGSLKVSVTAAPEKGKANKALLETLARALGIKKQDLSLARGDGSRDKWVAIQGIEAGELKKRIQGAMKK